VWACCHQSEREREREKERIKVERKKERDRGRKRIVIFILKGLMGVLAPFSYLVRNRSIS
jgi:hypothetical protein